MSSKNTDPPAPETPGGVWPPAPRMGAPDASTPPRRRTLTPFVWLDAMIGLIGGFAVAYSASIIILLREPYVNFHTQDLVFLGIAILVSATAFLIIGRRFFMFAVTLTLGALSSVLFWLIMTPIFSAV